MKELPGGETSVEARREDHMRCGGVKGGTVVLRRIFRLLPSLESRGKVISSMEKRAYLYPYLWLCELKSWGRNKTTEITH